MPDERRANLVIGVAAVAILGVCGWRIVDAVRGPAAIVAAKVNGGDPSRVLASGGRVADDERAVTPMQIRSVRLTAPPLRGVAARPPRSSPADAALPPVPHDVARVALDFVGSDPVADDVWMAAINDPRVPAHDRSDLIEDLNENGFADPEHVTLDELPLVMSRIALIEQLAPQAMDATNFAAFAEAYKDLTTIAVRLQREQLEQQQGETPGGDGTAVADAINGVGTSANAEPHIPDANAAEPASADPQAMDPLADDPQAADPTAGAVAVDRPQP